MKHIKYIAYISLFLLASCSTTKNLPEGEVLYTGIKKIEVTNEDKSKEGEEALTEIEAALAYPPNNALLGSSSIRIPLPFGLWMYNAFVNRKGKVGKWIFNKLASKPVFINTVNPEVRTKVAYNLLREYGYFNGATSYEVEPDPKNPKKAKISYKVEMNNATHTTALLTSGYGIASTHSSSATSATGFYATEIISMSYNSKPNASASLPCFATTGITISVPNLSATRPIRS